MIRLLVQLFVVLPLHLFVVWPAKAFGAVAGALGRLFGGAVRLVVLPLKLIGPLVWLVTLPLRLITLPFRLLFG